jgi:hypothetical protein
MVKPMNEAGGAPSDASDRSRPTPPRNTAPQTTRKTVPWRSMDGTTQSRAIPRPSQTPAKNLRLLSSSDDLGKPIEA